MFKFKFPKNNKRRALLLCGLVLAICPGCYTTNWVLRPWNAVRLFESDGPLPQMSATNSSLLRIGIYNIAHGRGTVTSNWKGGDVAERKARLHKIAQFLKHANLDIVVLNEVDFDSHWSHGVNQARFIAREAGFGSRVEQRNIDLAFPFFSLKFGNAILSRHPISDARLVDYPAYSRWESVLAGKKQGVVCTIDLPSGRQVRVLAVHLSHRSEPVRIAAAKLIEQQRRQSSIPLIAAGDFNSTPLGFPNVKTDKSGQSALSMLLESGEFATMPVDPPGPSELTFPSTDPEQVIDWILVSAPCKLVSKEVYPVQFSDHRPVIGVIQIDAH